MCVCVCVCVCERERERERERVLFFFLFFCVEEFQYVVALGFVDVMDALNRHTRFTFFIA